MLATMASAYAASGIPIGSWVLPWSWVFWIVVVLVGLFLIRAAITLVKVAIVVAIGFGVYLVVQFLFNNFG